MKVHHCEDCGDYKVRVVDAEKLRAESEADEEFGDVMIHEDLPHKIPSDEIWLADTLPKSEVKILLESIQVRIHALNEGVPSGTAYDRSLSAERAIRMPNAWSNDEWSRLADFGWSRWIMETEEEKVQIVSVDGEAIRNNFKTDWLMGGNPMVYPWIPKDEIWVEARLSISEQAITILHEYVEMLLMRERTLGYEEAHKIASRFDHARRGKFTMADVAKLTPAILDEIPKSVKKADRKSRYARLAMKLSPEERVKVKAALKIASSHVDALMGEAEQNLRSTFQWEELHRLELTADQEFEKAFLEAMEDLEAGKEPEEDKGRIPFHGDDDEEAFQRANDARIQKFSRGVE